MNKLYFSLIAICSSGMLAARHKTPADQLMAFNTMEKSHKDDWFKFMKEQVSAKSDILKRQHDDWADFRNGQVTKEVEADLSTHEAKEALLQQRLHDAIALHKKHIAAWDSYSKMRADKTKLLADKHKAQLAKFEQQLD